MKKILFIVLGLATLIGCGNQNTLGFGNYTFNYVTCNEGYLNIKNEPVSSWKDYDGEQIEVTLMDGNNLLISANSCFLSRDKISK